MVILGIDPGLQFSGFGVIKKDGGRIILMDYGFLKMKSSKSLSKRVREFHDNFDFKIKKWGVTDVSLETPFLGKNAQNFLKLGYLRGILYLLAEVNNLKIHEFTPRQVKLSVTGFGGAQKDQVARVIKQLFPLMPNQEKNDVTDAIAVTLCGVWQQKNFNII